MSTTTDRAKAHTRYLLSDGTQVPSVTTIIGETLGWNKQALIRWANAEGLAGRESSKTRDIAADIGTLTHKLVQAHLEGKPEPDLSGYAPADVEKAKVAFSAFKEWWKQSGLSVLWCEFQLVHEELWYGGTIDILACRVVGRRRKPEYVLLDIKTGNDTYPEHVVQVAAYAELIRNTGWRADAAQIVRLNKESGAVLVKDITKPMLRAGLRVFKHLREIYELRKALQ